MVRTRALSVLLGVEDDGKVVRPAVIPYVRSSAQCRAGKDVMRDYGYLEHLGMGVRLKIVQGMRDHNGTEPGLIEKDERFTVILYK